jgi:hypothetical protein
VSDTTVANAIRDIILPLGFVPSTTLTAGALVGDTVLTVANGGVFPLSAPLVFADAHGERRIPIASTDTTTITLDTANIGLSSGLQFAHASGTTVYSNLYVGMPIAFGDLTPTGWPAISVMVMGEDERQVTIPNGYENSHVVHVGYTVRLSPPNGSGINPNVWALEQQDLARVELEAIAAALRANNRLITASGNHAIDLGAAGSPGETRIRKDWSRLTGDYDVLSFTAAMLVFVRERPIPV